MRVLVTGASGFIGGHVVEALAGSVHDITAFVRPSSDTSHLSGTRIVYGDITDPRSCLVACRGQDVVIHNVGVVGGYAHWRTFSKTGVQGTQNMLDSARIANVKRLVYISSGAVYSTPRNNQPVTESSSLVKRPRSWNHYVRQKLEAEALLWRCHREGHLAATIIRPFVVLGKRDRHTSPRIVRFLSSPLAGLIGSGNNHIPCVVVEQLARLIVRASLDEAAAGKAYNVSGQRPITQGELLQMHAEAAGLSFRSRHYSRGVVEKLSVLMEKGWRLTGRKAEPMLTRFALSIATTDCLVDCSLAKKDLRWRGDACYARAVSEALGAMRIQ